MTLNVFLVRLDVRISPSNKGLGAYQVPVWLYERKCGFLKV